MITQAELGPLNFQDYSKLRNLPTMLEENSLSGGVSAAVSEQKAGSQVNTSSSASQATKAQ